MSGSVAMVTLLVRDYDEAIAFFTRALRFELVEDSPREESRGRRRMARWRCSWTSTATAGT